MSRTSRSHWTMMLSVPPWPPVYFQLGSWGFDYFLWVLIVTDQAHHWLHFIQAKEGCILPVELGHLGRSALAVHWPQPSRDGEGHVSSSYSPWVVWLSTYLHLSAGASFSLHPSPSSLSLRRHPPSIAFNVYSMPLCYDIELRAPQFITGSEWGH